jgi:hypothetical protein
MAAMLYRVACGVTCLLAVVGCTRGDVSGSSPTISSPKSVVVVVGDATATEVAAQLRAVGINVADQKIPLSSATFVVIAQDATTGLMPVHRSVAEAIARGNVRRLLWILTSAHQVADQELLELEELEARELLTTCGLPGDTIQFAVDTESPPVATDSPSLRGWEAIGRYVAGQAPR